MAVVLSVAILITTCTVGVFAYDTSKASEEYAAKLHISKVDDMQTDDGRALYRIDIMFMGNEIQNAQGVVFTLNANVFEFGYIDNGVVKTRAAGDTQATEYTSMSNTATRTMYVLPAVASKYYDDFDERYIDGGDHAFTAQSFGFKYDISENLLYYKVALNTDTGYMYNLGVDNFTTIASVYAVIKKDAEIATDSLKWAEPGVMRGESNSIQINNGVYRYIYKDSGTSDPQAVEITDDRALISGLPQIKINAATPVITEQPQSASYIKNATAEPLTVSVTVADSGTLTYEWFKNTVDSTTDGISVGTDVTYTPETDKIGVTYYYVVITNTNNEATGEKTAKVTGSTAKIEITEDPDLVALNTAKINVEAATYGPIVHKNYENENAVVEYVRAIAEEAAGNGITVTVNKVLFVEPIDGTAADTDGKGTDGTYTFTVTLAKSGKEVTTKELSLTVEATAFQGITDAQAVAAAMAVTGGTVNVDYGADQTAKTAAVQAYVNAELANIANAVGVTATVALKSENIYTVTYTKNAVNDNNDIEMIVVEGEDPNIAIVADAVNKAETAIYADMAQSAATDTIAIKAQIKAVAVNAINNDEVVVDIEEIGYIEATEGTSADIYGVNGSYSFKIKISKGIRSAKTTEKTITITATKYTGVSDEEAVAAAKNALSNGSVDVSYGATQEDKTTAVQNYVNTELAKIADATGVRAVVTYDTDNKYIVSLNKGSVNDTVKLEMTVNVGVNPAIAIVEAAFNAVNADIYKNMTQAEVTGENVVMNAVKADAIAAVNDARVTVSVVDSVYTLAVAGTSANPAGTNGTYTFKIQVANGGLIRTTEEKSIVITATAYDGITDVQAVEAAKNIIKDGEITVALGTSEEDKLNAVQTYFDNLMVGAAEGVTVTIMSVNGDEYTVKLTKGNANATKTIIITVNEAEPEKLDVPSNPKFRDGVASWNTVTNAKAYIVRLYGDGSKIYEIETKATTYDFNLMLEEGKSYLFTVEAIGDGVNYLNSDESSESNEYTVSGNNELRDDLYLAMMFLFNQKYTITAFAGEGGSITPVGKTEVKYGNSTYYIITPDEGYEIENVFVDGENVGAVTEYTFKRVHENHSILVNFVKLSWDNPFIDVFEADTYYDAIRFVYENGLFKGVSDNEFAPDTTMTRAMFVTVLGRLADVDISLYTDSSFDDVEINTWYAPYVEWAARNGIVKGYGNGKFGVNDNITVEQAMVILTEYADYVGIDTDSDVLLEKYSDVGNVSDWAIRQMKWVVSEEIYNGVNDKLNPQAPAKRSLVAEILHTFVKKFGE